MNAEHCQTQLQFTVQNAEHCQTHLQFTVQNAEHCQTQLQFTVQNNLFHNALNASAIMDQEQAFYKNMYRRVALRTVYRV